MAFGPIPNILPMDQGIHHQISYFDAAKSRYPNLKNIATDLGQSLRECHVAVIQFDYNGRQLSQDIYRTAPELQKHFESRCQPPKSGIKRVYLMEDLQEDFIEVVASFFRLNLFLFGTQIRSTLWEQSAWRNNITPNLLSNREFDGMFTIWYFEAFVLDKPYHYDIKLNAGRRCIRSTLPTFGGVRLVRRRASFWSRQGVDGGWDGIPLCP